MQVRTNLRSGNALNNATAEAGRAVNTAAAFLTKADAQAGNLTRGTITTTGTLINCLSRSLGGA